MPHRTALLVIAAGLLSLSACGRPGATAPPSASPGPSPTAVIGERPSPTPVTIVVGSPADAAALVVASDPRFAGVAPRRDDLVGQSRYWVATALDGGRFRIDVTIGWGDCQAGCIDRHVWTYEVSPDGRFELVSEAGPEVPPDIR